MERQSLFPLSSHLGFDSEFPGGPDARLLPLFGRLDVEFAGRQRASLGARQFLAKVQRLGFLARVEFAQLSLLLLVGDGKNASDGLSHDANFGQLAGGATSHFGDSQGSQFLLELLKLLNQLFLLLSAKFVRLNFNHLEFLSDKFFKKLDIKYILIKQIKEF